MGTLYLATDPMIARQVAIKLLRDDFDNEQTRKRFLREARAAGSLSHPNIVDIYDIGEDGGRPFIVMEYIVGETLAAIIRQRSPSPTTERLRLLEDLCRGLAYAHAAGVVHRDVKPANLIVDRTGTIKILDFGIARQASSDVTETGSIAGTLNYMAPEQLQGQGADKRCDIFAVGAVCYEFLSFQQAFPGDLRDGLLHRIITVPPRALDEVRPDLPRDVVDIVQRMLEKDPSRRYQDLSEAAAAITRIRRRLQGHPDEDETIVPKTSDPGPGLSPVSRTISNADTVLVQPAQPASGQSAEFTRETSHASHGEQKTGSGAGRRLMWPIVALGMVALTVVAIEIYRNRLNLAPIPTPAGPVAAKPDPASVSRSGGQPESNRSTVGDHLAKAQEYARARQLRAAIGEYELALSLDPANQEAATEKRAIEAALREVDSKVARADQYFQTRQYRAATSAYGAALALDPANEKALEGRRRAESALGESVPPVAPGAPPGPGTGSSWTAPIDGRTMIWIPPGTFEMGSPVEEFVRDADENLHSVTIGLGFWLDESEVTKAAYQKFILSMPEWRKGRVSDETYLKDWEGTTYSGDGDSPVVFVSWTAAAAYAAWAGKRLPTEAEWEYAARAGTKTGFWWGDDFDATKANNGLGVWRAHASQSRNPWGLFNMLGNVQEWTSSLYRPYPYRKDDGREDAADVSHDRVVRGGAFNSKSAYVRSANRVQMAPATTDDRLGFRCALGGAK
jgi:serine/threonine protein kinase/formylglycine-generating enzyme required for sulfatase activity